MTVSSTTVKNSYSGNGSNDTFVYGFKIFADTDLEVIIRSATGTETIKTLTTHYTVTNAGSASGGNVVFTAGNIPTATETVVVRREVPQTQAIDYIANDPFPAESHEEGLDRATMTIQQLQEEVNRAIKLSATNTMTSTEFTVGATDRANKVLSFDASGELSVAQELGTFKGNSATTTTAAYVVRDIVKGTTAAQLNNIYICIKASPVGTALTNTTFWVLIVDAVSAATSATASAASATTSGNSATASANSATTSANSATTSGNSATASANSATASANSATAAAASADAFDDIYLGTKSSDPSTDNDGDALAEGMLYFNSTSDSLRVYNGSAWQDAAVDTTAFLTLTGTQTLTNKTITSPKIGTKILDTAGNELALLTATSSAVNEFTVANAATNNAPRLSSTGGDSNVDLDLLAKGTGHVTIRGNTNPGTLQFNCENNTHGQQIIPQPHSVASSAVHTLPNITGDLIAGKIGGTNFTNSLLVGHATTGTLNAASSNTGVGIASLDAITTGDQNTAIGHLAGSTITGGAQNTAVGYNAFVTGRSEKNTAIGSNSLSGAILGAANNTALGQASLLQTTEGSYNLGLGRFSGQNITTGDGNVIIGSVDASSATGDRQLKIAGNDGSTTTTWISGDSSGNVTVTGTLTSDTGLVKTAGKETIWIPASAMYGATTNPADAQQVETTAVRPDMKVLDFDASTDEFAQFSIAFPKSWNEGTVTYQVYWTPASTNTGNCIFGLQGVSCGDNDTIDVAYGTAINITDAGIGTVEDQQVSSVSSAVTIAGSPAVDQLTYFQLFRDANAGGDTFSADARVLGVKIFYTTDAANDA